VCEMTGVSARTLHTDDERWLIVATPEETGLQALRKTGSKVAEVTSCGRAFHIRGRDRERERERGLSVG